MKKSKIIVHCLVKNEENFIWYALKSVLPYVDKIMVWDNGSIDKTVEIIKTIHSPKIAFEKHPTVSREGVGHLRQEMLNSTPKNYDWLFLLDGDEIWSSLSLTLVLSYIYKHPSAKAVITKTFNLVGDIYHRLPEKYGRYSFLGKTGNFSLRFINLLATPGLHVSKPYGTEGYYDKDNLSLQAGQGLAFVNTEYFHSTHLPRSSTSENVLDRPRKLKYYLGEKNDRFTIPKIFFSIRPSLVPDVSRPMDVTVWLMSFLQTIMRFITDPLKRLWN